jgi:tetratricopeptide (TPR) repeat protein
VRQYALERLDESGERQEALRRHARYWMEFAEEAEERLTGARAAEQLEALEREHDNLRTALEFCFSEAREGLHGLRLAGALTHFWQVRSHFSEGSRWIEAALSHPGAQEATTERARALSGGGSLAYRQGRYKESRALQSEALGIHRSLGNLADVAFSLNSLGNVANDLGEADAARRCYEEALKVNREIGNRDRECSNLINLGVLAMRQGDNAAAKPPLVEARAALTEMGSKDGLLFAVSNLANVALSAKEYKEALPLYLEALELSQELGDRRTATEVIEAIAQISAQTGKEGMIRAAKLVGAAAAERERIGSPPHPPDQEQLDELSGFVQSGLGKEATARAHSEGRAMDWKKTVELAYLG